MKPFKFKEFTVHQDKAAMKVGTDAVLLGAWCEIGEEVDTVLDIGAGTGVISLMIAQRSNAMTIDAVELDQDAYEQCVGNFEQSDWGDRLFCYHTSFQDFAKELKEEEETYELIVSNPPFYNDEFQTENESRNKARFTNSLSFKDLIAAVNDILDKKGKFVIIIPYKEQEAFVGLAKEKGLFLNKVCEVQGNNYTGIIRVMLIFSYLESKLQKEKLIIEKERHQYTSEYKGLTKDFYLKF